MSRQDKQSPGPPTRKTLQRSQTGLPSISNNQLRRSNTLDDEEASKKRQALASVLTTKSLNTQAPSADRNCPVQPRRSVGSSAQSLVTVQIKQRINALCEPEIKFTNPDPRLKRLIETIGPSFNLHLKDAAARSALYPLNINTA